MVMVILAASLSAMAAPTTLDDAKLDLRFCPAAKARSYPLDTVHNATSLVLQNVAMVNSGSQPITIDSVKIELLRGDRPIDTRIVDASDIATAAKGGQALASSGLMAAIGFQFCDGALLGNAKLASSGTIAPGEALLLMHQSFAWRGKRDAVRVSVGTWTATVPIDDSLAPPMRWPLAAGAWTVAAGASFHSSHRWAVPEQFALDIVKVDADGRTHRASGNKLSDFYAYGAPVVSAAAGSVVAVTRADQEDPPLLRRPGETLSGYLNRVGEAQAIKLTKGEAAILGESVIIDQGGGIYAVYAHLRPGSGQVKIGDKVVAGQRIAALGNSGNSTEPHLHFQLCDRPTGLSCAGIPLSFSNIDLPLADGPRPIQSGDIVSAE